MANNGTHHCVGVPVWGAALGIGFWRNALDFANLVLLMKKRSPARTASVNPIAAQVRDDVRALWREQQWIWGIFAGLALVLVISGAEVGLAKAIYQPDTMTLWGGFAWELRQWGAAVPGYIAVAALGVLLFPALKHTKPLVYNAALVMVFAAVLGAGLVNQVLVQELTDRHRPRETVLINKHIHQLPAELEGNSFPSGHAGIAFVLAAPFFVLRRHKPKLAKAVLAGGVGVGFLVGIGRMGLGAHYASDVLVAGAITLSAASVAAWWMDGRTQPISRRWLMAGACVALVGVLLGNAFKVTLMMPLDEPLPRLNVPCVVEAVPNATITRPTLVVHVKGYGAPVSNIGLVNMGGVVRIHKGLGVYHSMRCHAQLKLPLGQD